MPQSPYDDLIRQLGGTLISPSQAVAPEPSSFGQPPTSRPTDESYNRWVPQEDPYDAMIREFGGTPYTPPQPASLFDRFVSDPAVSLARGVHEAAEVPLGLADIATGGYAGKLVEQYTPWRPQEMDAYLQSLYTQEQQQAFANVQKAEGFLGTLQSIIENPSVIPHGIIETIPGMYAGGAIGGAAVRAAEALGPAAVRAGLTAVEARKAQNAIARISGAIGEGSVSMGQAAETTRQQDPNRTLSGRGSLAALATGAATTGFGIGGERAGHALGITDIDQRIANQFGKRTLKEVAQEALLENDKVQLGVARQIVYGFMQEGFLEELPQSVVEQVLANYGQGKDLMDGVAQAGVLGAVIGGVMGAGSQAQERLFAEPRPPKEEADKPLPPPPPGAEAPPAATPPIGAPPVGAPPVGAPPVGAPPAGTPPTGAPPIGVPPTEAPPTPPTPPYGLPPGAEPRGQTPPGTLPSGLSYADAQALAQLGYYSDQIAEMTPEQARRIISDAKGPQQRLLEPGPSTGENLPAIVPRGTPQPGGPPIGGPPRPGTPLPDGITYRMSQQLAELGYHTDQIASMHGDQARQILDEDDQKQSRIAQEAAERKYQEDYQALQDEEERQAFEDEHGQQLVRATARRERAERALALHIEREQQRKLEADQARRAEQQQEGESRTAAEQQAEDERRFMEDYEAQQAQEAREEELRRHVAAAEAEENALSNFLKGLHQEAQTAAQRQREAEYLQRLTPEQQDEYRRQQAEARQRGEEPPDDESGTPPTGTPPTAPPAAEPPPTDVEPAGPEALDRETPADAPDVVKQLVAAAHAIDPKVNPNTIKKTYEQRLMQAQAMVQSAQPGHEDTGLVDLAKAIAAAGGWNEVDRVVGNRYWKPRTTGEMQSVKDAAKAHALGTHGNAGAFGSMAGVSGVFRNDGLPTDVLLQDLQQGDRFPEFAHMDASQFRAHVLNELARSGGRSLGGQLTLGNLRIDPAQQWWVPAHLRAISRVAQSMRQDRAAAQADTDFDPGKLETPTGPPTESRWKLKDLKRGLYEEQRDDNERGAHQYPQSVYEALHDHEFQVLAQLQEADLSTLDTHERELFIELHSRLQEAMTEAQETYEAEQRDTAEPSVEEETPTGVTIKKDSPHYGDDPEARLEASLDDQRGRYADRETQSRIIDNATVEGPKVRRARAEFNAITTLIERGWQEIADTFEGIDVDALKDDLRYAKPAPAVEPLAPLPAKPKGTPPINQSKVEARIRETLTALLHRNLSGIVDDKILTATRLAELKDLGLVSGRQTLKPNKKGLAILHGEPAAPAVEQPKGESVNWRDTPMGKAQEMSDDALLARRKEMRDNREAGLDERRAINDEIERRGLKKEGPPSSQDQPRLPGDVGNVRDVEIPTPEIPLPTQHLTLTGEEANPPKPASLFDQSDQAHQEVKDAISALMKDISRGGKFSNFDPTVGGKLPLHVFRIVQAIAKAGVVDARLAWKHYIEPAFGKASGDLVSAFKLAWKQVHGTEPDQFVPTHEPSKSPEEKAERFAQAVKDFEQKTQAAQPAATPVAKPEGPPRTVAPAAPKVETKPPAPKTAAQGPPRAATPVATPAVTTPKPEPPKPAAPAATPVAAPAPAPVDMSAYDNLSPYQKAWVDASVLAQQQGMGMPSFTRFNIPPQDHARLLAALAARLQQANTAPAPKTATPATAPAGPTEPVSVTDEQKAILDEHDMKPVGYDMRGNVPVVKIQGKTDKATYDRKELFNAVDGRFKTIPFKHWQIPLRRLADFIRALGLLPKAAGRPAGRLPAHIRDASLAQLRTSAAARPDRSGFVDGIQQYISPRTQGVIQRGEDVGIRQETLDEQKQDVAILVRNYERNNKAGILASDPGTGKTYVLGGTIAELVHRGLDSIIYVTKNEGLITQAKKDMAGFGIGDRVQFMTYAKFRETDPPENGVDLLIFDEAHEVKNLKVGQESSQAKQAQQWIANAKYTIMATATPYENPTQLQYLSPTGIFDDVFGAFHKFAAAFGATPILMNKEAVKTGADPIYRYDWKRTISSNDDQKAAREWMRKEGFFTSRKMRLPKEQTETHLVKVTGDPETAELFKALMDAREDNPAPGFAAAWVTNFGKRLLESSKIEVAIEQAQKALDRGRFPIIFIETKAENILDINYLAKEERRWEEAAALAKRAGMEPPSRKTAGYGGENGLPPIGIVPILQQVQRVTGKDIIHIKPAEQMVQDAFGKANVAIYTGSVDDKVAQKNLAAWRTQGEPRVLVATMAKGGTGLSLHDKVGNHQTTQINVNLPWTPTGVVQVTQRSMRYGMQGTAESMWLFASNIAMDRHLSKIVGRRLQDMGSLVHGEVADDAVDLDNYNFEDLVHMEAAKEKRDRAKAGLTTWRDFRETTPPTTAEREHVVFRKDTGEEDVPLPYDDSEYAPPTDDDEGSDEEPPPEEDDEGEGALDEPPPPPVKPFYDAPPKGPATHPVTGTPIHGLGLTELVELTKDWIGLPKVVEKFRKMGTLGLLKIAADKAGIQIKASLFEKGNERELLQVLAHEIGHLIDWLPDHVIKRGNLLGRVFTLRKFMEHTFITPEGRIVLLKDIEPELRRFDDIWSPYDKDKASQKYRQYRESSVELMAQALSALLTDPETLQKNAPNFFREFFNAMDRKPEVLKSFEAIQAVMQMSPEDRADRRVERDLATKAAADIKAVDIEKQKVEAAKAAKWENWWLRLKAQMLDKHAPVIQRVKKLASLGREIAEHLDPRYMLQERNYIGGKIKGWLSRNVYPLVLELDKHGINWHQFGLALEYDRTIMGDYEGKLSPNGLTPETAQANRDSLARRLTPQQNALLEDSIDKFRNAVGEIIDEAYEAGLYTPKQYKEFKKNPAYATFRGIDFLDQHISARVIHAKGSAQELQNVGTATILKMIVTMRETQNQKVKRSVFDMLEQNPEFENDIERARRIGENDFAAPKNRDLEEVGYFDNGVWQRMYVDPLIADSLNNKSIGHNFAVIQAISYLNTKIFRPLFVGVNPGFMTFNLPRDFLRSWKNFSDNGVQMSLAQMVKRYRQSHSLAKIRAFGKPKNMTAKEEAAWSLLTAGEEHFVFGLPSSRTSTRHVQETELDDILTRMHVREEQGPPTQGWRKAIEPVSQFLNWMEKVGNYVETLPKAAALYEMLGDTKNVEDLTPTQRSFIREKVGTPDIHAGGTLKPITNELFLFSNIIFQGWRADMNVARRDIQGRLPEKWGGTDDPKTLSGWVWKTAALNVLPKMIMAAATAGLMGAWLRKLFDRVSEYDKSNYLIVPIDLDEKGNAIYLRLPQDDTGRFIGGLAWKAMRGDKNIGSVLAGMTDYTNGQLVPSLTPSIKAVGDTGLMMSGQNPYDAFRSRNLFTDQEMAAGGARNWQKFLGWEFNQLGGSTYFGNFFREKRPEEQTVGQKILDFPVSSNVLGRWLRVSDYGLTEQMREAKGEIAGGKARLSRDERDEVNDAIRELQKRHPQERSMGSRMALARKIVESVYADMPRGDRSKKTMEVQKKIAQGLVRGSADPWVDEVMNAGSNAEKRAVIERARQDMDKAEFTGWLDRAASNAIISRELSMQIKTGRPTR